MIGIENWMRLTFVVSDEPDPLAPALKPITLMPPSQSLRLSLQLLPRHRIGPAERGIGPAERAKRLYLLWCPGMDDSAVGFACNGLIDGGLDTLLYLGESSRNKVFQFHRFLVLGPTPALTRGRAEGAAVELNCLLGAIVRTHFLFPDHRRRTINIDRHWDNIRSGTATAKYARHGMD